MVLALSFGALPNIPHKVAGDSFDQYELNELLDAVVSGNKDINTATLTAITVNATNIIGTPNVSLTSNYSLLSSTANYVLTANYANNANNAITANFATYALNWDNLLSGVIGEYVTTYDVLVFKSDNKWYRASNVTENLASGMLAIVPKTLTANDTVNLFYSPKSLEYASWDLATGNRVFLGANGSITVNQTATTDYIVRLVGYSLGNKKLMFDPNKSFITR